MNMIWDYPPDFSPPDQAVKNTLELSKHLQLPVLTFHVSVTLEANTAITLENC